MSLHNKFVYIYGHGAEQRTLKANFEKQSDCDKAARFRYKSDPAEQTQTGRVSEEREPGSSLC